MGMRFGLFGEVPSVDFADLVTQTLCNPSNISTGCNAIIDFLLQAFDLGFCSTRFIGAIQIMIAAIMMDSVTSKISLAVNIPSGIVGIGIQAVPDVATLNFLVAGNPSIPSLDVANDKNRSIQLDVSERCLT